MSVKNDIDLVHYVLREMVGELDDANDYAEESWFQRCDALWQFLLEGEIAYRALDLDGFYLCYFRAAAYQGLPERVKPGLEAYLELLLKVGAEDNKSEDVLDTYTMFDCLLTETLVYTPIYDEKIIRFLKDACSIMEENEVSIPEGADDITRIQMEMNLIVKEVAVALLRSWIGMLDGDTQMALLKLPDAYMEEPLYKYMYKMMWVSKVH